MAESNTTNLIPSLPKALGFSRRLLLTMGLGVVLVVALYLFFLNHYAPKPRAGTPSEEERLAASAHPEDIRPILHRLQQQINHPKAKKSQKSVAYDSIWQKKNQENHQEKALISSSSRTVTSERSEKDKAKEAFLQAAMVAPIEIDVSTLSKQMAHPTIETQDSHSPGAFLSPSGFNANKPSDYQAQNQQSEKIAFLKNAGQWQTHTLTSTRERLITPFELKAGSIIPATLVTAVNSDLPGPLVARIRRSVYDTATGNYLLIPQGTTLIGQYDSQISYGQSRILIAWSRLIFPDGSSFDLAGMPGADLAGAAGLKDRVDHHYARIFGSALLFSIFNASAQLSQPKETGDDLNTQQVIYAAIGQQISQLGAQLIEQNMNIQPTLTLRQGMNFNVLLTRDLVLEQPYG